VSTGIAMMNMMQMMMDQMLQQQELMLEGQSGGDS
jgi:hypothetical protein